MKVAGLPEPRRDHAEVMARFGHDILRRMNEVTTELATFLGPGTSTLQMRVGVRIKFIIDKKMQHQFLCSHLC